MSNRPYFAEVIASSLQNWTAQSWAWDKMPDFATLVVVEENERKIFGVVYHIETRSWHNDRTPFPYQKTEEELLREQPQIFELLRTTFTCLTLGYQKSDGCIVACYAPRPPKIHSFIRSAYDNEVQEFFEQDHSLPMLFAAGQHVNLDELLLGIVQFRIQKGLFGPDHCAAFMNTFSLLTGNDYRKLKVFLQRLQPLMEMSQSMPVGTNLHTRGMADENE